MWQLLNHTPYQAERAFARDKDGAEHWVVAVRMTFTFDEKGKVSLAPEQQPVRLAPEFFGDPSASSLRYDTDVVPGKQRTDIVVHASAHASRNRAVRKVEVGFSVGPVSKRLRVVGDRVWVKSALGTILSAPVAFESVPVRYERARGGGPDSPEGTMWNPVGRSETPKVGNILPNLDHADSKGGRRRDSTPPGFGPIASHWSPRAERAGTYDANWEDTRKPLLPLDFDPRHRQCAPDDQQAPGWLRGGETVVLHALTPEGSVGFVLPRIALGFDTHMGGSQHHHTADLHTVIIEPDERLVVLVWQTALRCHGFLPSLRGTTVYEKRHI